MNSFANILRFFKKSEYVRRPKPVPTPLGAESLEKRSMMAFPQLSALDVEALLDRASAATPSRDAIIAIVDRSGQILGGDLSQSTITQREVEANPSSLNESIRGPGFVAAVGVGGQFPPGIINQPLVDLFAIEHSNRVSTVVDGVLIANRKSYGQQVGTAPNETSRGIGTLPGGLPVYRANSNQLIAGIGAFFPGPFGFASFEQGFVPVASQTQQDRVNAPRVIESELIVFQTLFVPGSIDNVARPGITGAPQSIIARAGNLSGTSLQQQINQINAAARINLGGIALQSFGPKAGPLGVQA